ncbi:hypothetical protein N0V93_000148 [Gnomoniopsis smithogilvyi]|uniref:FAD-binding FR-type domain-containing protein n=1 Tax=Gnomoniopsis smithogilvyi TaxID=1191159 RepID=A0A9W8YZ97_9PEZI|nr:hypothetical protein N0V93_000148 [Gnomoniopsis smithogilvyi]
MDFTARTLTNRQQLRYYAAGICGLMAVFIITHWLRVVFNKLSPSSKNPVRSASRLVRNLLVRKFPGFPSSGHALVVAAYVATNLAVTFTNVDISVGGIANRCGWMLLANFCIVVFLALKNTPLAVLSAYSYERLNGLHQIAGYTTFLYLVLHASMYTNYFMTSGYSEILTTDSVKAGIVAGFAFLGIAVSGAIIRHIWYEAFFVIHVTCFLVALIAAAKHQPDLATNGLLIMLAIIAAMWGADRLVRGSRMLYYSFNNYAVLEPLPNGGTRVVLAKKPYAAVPGKHCFVWIPAIRAFESHPFTIAATEPMEFVVNAYDGFTRDLHKRAVANPGVKLRVSVDGPYGTFPDPMTFDKVVLIAGGSGATFTFGLVTNMLERMGPETKTNIVLIWAVKKHDNLSWFADHLQTLKTHPHSPKVTTSLYVTTAASSSNPASADVSDAEDDRRALAVHGAGAAEKTLRPSIHTSSSSDPEKTGAASSSHSSKTRHSTSTDATAHSHGHAILPGRPDTAALIREAVSSTPATGRVLVAACGPAGLMRTVRDVTAGLIRGDGPGVELHCEQFGW